MKRFVVLAALLGSLAVPGSALGSHPAGLFTSTDQVATMDDGVGIATSLYVPFEHAPHPGTFPAVMMFHGLGGNRRSIAPIAETFARRGYVVLTFDFRGHGESGGLFTGVGPRELTDIAILREQWLPAKAPINGAVGAWGISLGGGAALRATAERRTFKALAVVETWTDLYDALVPQGLPKTGAIFQFLGAVPRERQSPELLELGSAVARRDLGRLRTFSQGRSTRHLLGEGVVPPTIFFQGRRDFAFGLEQGVSAFQRTPRWIHLYIGPFGHAPSRFPGPDLDVVMARTLELYDAQLKGMPTDFATRPPVELAPDPFRGATVRYASLPATRTLRYTLPGRSTIRSAGKVVRRTKALASLQETFGAPTVRVAASSRTGWRHLVAVLVARTRDGREIVVSEGGAATRLNARPKTIAIRLISQVTTIPARSRLELTLAATSTAQNPQNLLYLDRVADRARITIGRVELRLPVLRRPISK